jgi:hypothetical protein
MCAREKKSERVICDKGDELCVYSKPQRGGDIVGGVVWCRFCFALGRFGLAGCCHVTY